MTLAPFGPVMIEADASVLSPRPWTLAQSTWAAELAPDAPEGPILELCCGAGQIGLAAAELTGRALVQVDQDAAACAWARRNADRNGIVSDIRNASLEDALHDDERFALVIADPPYLQSAEVARYPEDPQVAIDGGHDGLALIDTCLSVAARHTIAGVAVLLQVRGATQAEVVNEFVAARRHPFVLEAVRAETDERAVVLLRRVAEAPEAFLNTGAG
jgi:methylase of polypeptide subunit release factors